MATKQTTKASAKSDVETTAKKVSKKVTKATKASVSKTNKVKVSKAKKEVVEAVDAIEDVVEATSKSIFARLNTNISRVQGVAKQVWLANLGAAGRTLDFYAKAGDELQSRYTKLNKDGQELVEDLVARGEKVQDEAELRLKERRASVEEQIDVAKVVMLRKRVSALELKGLLIF